MQGAQRDACNHGGQDLRDEDRRLDNADVFAAIGRRWQHLAGQRQVHSQKDTHANPYNSCSYQDHGPGREEGVERQAHRHDHAGDHHKHLATLQPVGEDAPNQGRDDDRCDIDREEGLHALGDGVPGKQPGIMDGIPQEVEHVGDDRRVGQEDQAAGHPGQGKIPAAQGLQHVENPSDLKRWDMFPGEGHIPQDEQEQGHHDDNHDRNRGVGRR